MSFTTALQRLSSQFCVLSPTQIDVLERHYQLLVKWNRRLNLTTVIQPEEAARKHYAESLYLAVHLPKALCRIADIGSGAGFPGIPVAVFRPDISITLVESDIRKSAFLNECRDLVPNIKVANVRAESLGKGLFDALVARAVNPTHLELLLLSIAPRAFALAACLGSTWNVEAHVPWDDKSCVVSRETDKL
jgi:16S rRNA (guanine527-N7)-methyltransferase